MNLLLNILGKRADGFHELETVMQPVDWCDTLVFETIEGGIELTCSDATLPTDDSNLVRRAATRFLQESKIPSGVRIHLEKKIPMAAGLGGGSSNAATTLLALNELFVGALTSTQITAIAGSIGSDVPFFLQNGPALATGRGEKVVSLSPFRAFRGVAILLIHPGFGISTPWAYQQLARFPTALQGRPGRAQELISTLQSSDATAAARGLYNSLEAPALSKYPVLALYQEFLKDHGALGTLMSGSGSGTFGLFRSEAQAADAGERFQQRFGRSGWMVHLALSAVV